MTTNPPPPSSDPWRRLVALSRRCPASRPDPVAAPEFAAGVVARWARVERSAALAESRVDLWETLGLRVACAAGALAVAVLLLNLSSLQDLGANLDADALDPATLLLGPCL